jgi:predicted TIM-barrel fold metal-dependent hydrolase
MNYDIHVHLAGTDPRNGNYIAPRLSPTFHYLRRRLGLTEAAMRTSGIDDWLLNLLMPWVDQSSLDRVVVLAIDGAYRRDGTYDAENTRMLTGNDYVAALSQRHPRILFGASIHPYRRDAVAELDRVVARGACLIKWIPSGQNIQPDDPACFPFYEALASHGLPLLSHTGKEHTLSTFPNTLNDPRRLKPALDRGVTVIAAHCGTRLFLHDGSHFKAWCAMAREYERFYGDISAFAVVTRCRALSRIERTPPLLDKIVYGSDFPAPALAWSFVHRLGLRQTRALAAIPNPLERSYRIFRSLELPAEVFSRAGRLLRLPQEQASPIVADPVMRGGKVA